jgi:glutamate-1-semialdehyde 2,1-aminomutase
VADPPTDRSDALFERARRVIPGGVNSPVRSFRSVGGHPYFVVRGEGAYVWDADGNRLLDYVQSYGASILGHAHPAVVKAVADAAADGTTFGAPTEGEVHLAEVICGRVGGCEQIRLVSSGTEAAMTAVRVSRGFTGRSRVVKFAGCYHGHSDGLLAGGGSGVATLGLPDSAGVPPAAVAETLVVPYNSVPELGEDVACVIVEPVAANMGLVPPQPGFLEGLRAACDEAGALLVFDEVITGFRIGPSGASGQTGVRPDLWCFGKVIGGGLPVGAVGGRAEVLAVLAPDGPVYQAGTLSGNPLATAAGMAVLDALDVASYAELSGRVSAFAAELGAALNDALTAGPRGGHPAPFAAQVPVVGPLFGVFFTPVGALPVRDYAGAEAAAATGLYRRFFHGMLRRGVAIAPGPYEVAFPSLAHGPAEFERTLQAASQAAAELAA